MATYADKNAKGELTGRFRVELQKGKERYRVRHDTFLAAKEDDDRVKALWAAGAAATAPVAPKAVPEGITIDVALKRAERVLWRGKTNAACNYAHLRFFAALWGPETTLDAIDTAKVREGIEELEELEKADGTINRYLSHLRTFLAWHVKEKNRKAPIDDIVWDWRKESKGRIRWLSPEEERLLISLVPDNVGKLIKVAIQTGCRRAELLTVEADQIEGNLLHLWKTKTDSPRSVPLTDETAAILTELVTTRTMPTARSLRRRWDAAKDAMNLQEDREFVFHACRHTCATRLVDANVNLLVIKEWLGHKVILTTQRYAHVRPSALQAALVLVGEKAAALAQNPSNPAALTVPHIVPHAGVNDQFDIAA